jgi:hypothetical protein
MATCSRCGREATFTSKGGERVCDHHYHAVFAVAPTILSTSTTADALGARAVESAAGISAGGGGPTSTRRGLLARLWRRLRRR